MNEPTTERNKKKKKKKTQKQTQHDERERWTNTKAKKKHSIHFILRITSEGSCEMCVAVPICHSSSSSNGTALNSA